MQIQFDHIASGEALLRQRGEKQFMDDTPTRDTNRALLEALWMSRHPHAVAYPLWPHRHLWTVIETAGDPALRALLDVIGGKMQTRLDERVIKDRVLSASCYKGEASQVGEDSSSAILSIKPEQSTLFRELVHCKIAVDGGESLAQFLSVEPVASVAKGAEPLEIVSLADDRAGTHDLSALAPPIAWSADFIQSAKGRGQLFALGSGTLASGLTLAIDVKDHPGSFCSIHDTSRWLLIGGRRERAAEQIIKKEGAQGFDRFGCQRR